MALYEVFASLAVALGIGLLIGLEREQATLVQPDTASDFLGGARTYPLFALAGALSTLLGQSLGFWVIGLVFTALFVLLAIAYTDSLWKQRDRGITSETAFVVTFLLGVLCVSDGVLDTVTHRLFVAAALGVGVTILLSVKPLVSTLLHAVSKEDIYTTLKFLLVAVIILPLLPNRTYGPLDVLNPFQIGLMVVLITGISFVGYVAVRVLGPGRAMGLVGLVGGLVSSTAVTLASARQAHRYTHWHDIFAMAVALAASVMTLPVAVEVAIVCPLLLGQLTLSLAAMTAAGLSWAMWFSRRGQGLGGETATDVDLTNPVELTAAIKFGLLFAVLLMVAKAANIYVGEKGVYLAGVLAGVTDVDAMTLSIANLVRTGLHPTVGSTTIILGVASNSVFKIGIALLIGGRAFGWRVAAALGTVVVVGIATVLLTGMGFSS